MTGNQVTQLLQVGHSVQTRTLYSYGLTLRVANLCSLGQVSEQRPGDTAGWDGPATNVPGACLSSVAACLRQVTAVSVGLDKGVFIWDVRQDKPTWVVPNAHLHEITCCAINMRGGVVATGEPGCSVPTPNEMRSAETSSGSGGL